MQSLYDNFETARITVKSKIQRLKLTNPDYEKIISLNLKKMIIAEKQLDTKLPILTKKTQIFELLKEKSLIILEG